MATEVEDLREHFDRYRRVTLEHLDGLSDAQLLWRPRPDAFSCAQHFVHVVQTEDFYMRGLFQHDWDPERMRFPKAVPGKVELRGQFETVRALTLKCFSILTSDQLSAIVPPMFGSPLEWSLRSWLWYVLEHEVRHKAQLAEYIRQMGMVPPFFACVCSSRRPAARHPIARRPWRHLKARGVDPGLGFRHAV